MEPEPGPTLASDAPDEDLDCVLAVAEGDVPGAFALDVHKRQLRELLEDVKAGKWPSGQPRSFSPTYSGKASAEDFVKSTVSYVVFAPHLEPLKQFAVHLGDGAKLPTCPTCHDHQGVELKEWKWDALRVVTGLGRNLVVLFPAYKCKGCRGACTWRPGREEGDSAAAAGAADQWRVAHGRGEAVAACGGARHAARAGRRARGSGGSGARLPMRGQQRGNPTSCPLALLTGAKDDAKSTVFSAYSPQLVEELERRDKATGSVDAALFLEAMPFVLTGHGGIAKELVQRLLTHDGERRGNARAHMYAGCGGRGEGALVADAPFCCPPPVSCCRPSAPSSRKARQMPWPTCCATLACCTSHVGEHTCTGRHFSPHPIRATTTPQHSTSKTAGGFGG